MAEVLEGPEVIRPTQVEEETQVTVGEKESRLPMEPVSSETETEVTSVFVDVPS